MLTTATQIDLIWFVSKIYHVFTLEPCPMTPDMYLVTCVSLPTCFDVQSGLLWCMLTCMRQTSPSLALLDQLQLLAWLRDEGQGNAGVMSGEWQGLPASCVSTPYLHYHLTLSANFSAALDMMKDMDYRQL